MTISADSLQSWNQKNRAYVFPQGQLFVATEGVSLFADQFDGTTIDTVYRWNTPVTAGTGSAAQSGGLLSLSVGTTASNAAALSTIESFTGVGGSTIRIATLIQFEGAVSPAGLLPSGVHVFFGQGTPNASFTAATPLANAFGFERDITGNFYAVIYNANTRTIVADLTAYVRDGLPHLLAMAIRADTTYWFLDNIEEAVASIAITSPATTVLPLRFHAINHTSPPTVAPTIRFFGSVVIDSGNNYPASYNGQIVTRARSPAKFINLNAVSIATETTIWTPTTGTKFRLMGYVLETGTVGGNVLLKDGTGGTTILVIPFGAANGVIVSPPMGNGILSATINNVLTATGTATQTLSGYVFGTEE